MNIFGFISLRHLSTAFPACSAMQYLQASAQCSMPREMFGLRQQKLWPIKKKMSQEIFRFRCVLELPGDCVMYFLWRQIPLICDIHSPAAYLKVLCNATACWILLKYIRVNITNSSTVPYYASYIKKKKNPDFLGDIAKPRLQKNPDHLFLRWHHQPITKDKVMCLTIQCQSPQALAHNCITGFHTIPSYHSFLV